MALETNSFPMRVYTHDGITGYAAHDIESFLHALGGDERVADFTSWMWGQTMCSIPHEGALIAVVYTWDFDRYMRRLPVID